MITCRNINRVDNVPFEQYLALNGYSHSFLKRERSGITADLTITENIRIGSLVDSILTDPAKANMRDSLYPVAKQLAIDIRATFGEMIKRFEKQVSYTIDFTYAGLTMTTKGRLDFLLPGHAVIDLKVTKSKQITELIEHMGYKNQMWGYCKMAGVDTAYLLVHSIPLKKTVPVRIDCSSDRNEFWESKILSFGTATDIIPGTY